MILLILACAPEYHIDSLPPPEPEIWASTETCPGYAALWLPLEGEPLAVTFCAGELCEPLAFRVDGWLFATCPSVGTLEIVWTEEE